jgi:hypothetical protein
MWDQERCGSSFVATMAGRWISQTLVEPVAPVRLPAAGATSLSTLAAAVPIKTPAMSLRERTRPGLGIFEPRLPEVF